jgi:putative FmdB family regulatory protein
MVTESGGLSREKLVNWCKMRIIKYAIAGEVRSMPLYEYQCQECGLRFERRQHFNDKPVTVCPDCHGPVVRLIQPAGIIFKGSGFYVTDNRSKSSTAVPGNRKTDEKSSDEKPAAEQNTKADTAASGEGTKAKA